MSQGSERDRVEEGKKIWCATGAPTRSCASLLDGRHMGLAGHGQSKSQVRATVTWEENCDGNNCMWS